MKSKKWTLHEALDDVKSKRPSIGPNDGFMDQLRLFEAMCWKLDKSFLPYKLFKLSGIHHQVALTKILPPQVKASLGDKTASGTIGSPLLTPNSETSSTGGDTVLSNNNSSNFLICK
jgi:hypothetical protein